jgi:HEPN domain-containing protein
LSTPPEKARQVRQWLIKAERDLLVADRAAHQPPALRDVAVYHAQQAAEKALKAFLTWSDQPVRRTHDLIVLTGQCLAIDPSFAVLQASAVLLNPFAVAFRYPGDILEPTGAETDQAIEAAREVMAFVIGRVPAEARP